MDDLIRLLAAIGAWHLFNDLCGGVARFIEWWRSEPWRGGTTE